MDGFGLRGIPDMVGRFMVDNYIIYAWAIYALFLVMAFTVYLLADARRSCRAGRAFYPLAAAGIVMMFATPTGTSL